MKFKHYLEVELDLEADVTPAYDGGRDEPSEGASADICSVKINGTEIPLTVFSPKEVAAMQEAALEVAADREKSARDEAADRKFEEMRDNRGRTA